MPRSSSPRKTYRPRAINAPITQGLMGEFTECFNVVETVLHLRAQTTEHFDALAMLLNTIGPVALARFGADSPTGEAIVLAAEAMNTAAERARDAGGTAPMTDEELAVVSHGIDASKEAIPFLDVRSLAAQHQVVRRRIASEQAANRWKETA